MARSNCPETGRARDAPPVTRSDGNRQPATNASNLEVSKSRLDVFCPEKFHGCFSSDAVQDVISKFSEGQLNLVDRIGLGGLKYLKPGLHNSRHLVF